MPRAVAAAAAELAAAIDAIVLRLERGGRLIYVGAGTSGRIAALDAAECETTFSAAPGQVVALVAGAASRRRPSATQPRTMPPPAPATSSSARRRGRRRSRRDQRQRADPVRARRARSRRRRRRADRRARLRRRLRAGRGSPSTRSPSSSAPRSLAGSTRLKAGTAQKLVLNTISTVAMVRLGKTFGEPHGRRRGDERRSCGRLAADRPARDRRIAGRGGRSAGSCRRQREGRDRLAARRGGRRDGAVAAGCGRAAACDWRSTNEARRRSRARRTAAGPAVTSRSSTASSPDYGARESATVGGSPRPGFVDLQVNGFGGVDFLDADEAGYRARRRGAARDRRHRVPADASSPRPRSSSSPRSRRCRSTARCRASSAFISRARSSRPRRLGTHPAASRRDPDRALLERLLAAGPVRLMTLAPERRARTS